MSSISDKLTLANDNVPKIYMAGQSLRELDDFSYFFAEYARKTLLNKINTSNGTNFSYMFYNTNTNPFPNISYIDTSKGTNFKYMFSGCQWLKTVPHIDTSNGTNFDHMFSGCKSLTTIPHIDTSNGTDFTYMFSSCNSLTTIPQLNMSKGIIFESTFAYCTSLTTIPQFNASNGTNFKYTFYNCAALTTITQINVSKGTKFDNMFYNCSALTTISFTGSINASISFSYSSELTAESLQSIVNALSVNTSSTKPTLTLNSKAWTTLEATTPPTGSSTWKEYISTVKNWNYA